MANILVVDDEMGIRELLSEILGDEGHVVSTAENAQQAREVRQAAAPDLVLLDIWMPDTDGVTLLKEWQRDGMLTMPVIMMSGHATIDTAVEATRIGALNFLEKPISMQKLLKAVQQGLSRGQEVARPTVFHPRAVPPVSEVACSRTGFRCCLQCRSATVRQSDAGRTCHRRQGLHIVFRAALAGGTRRFRARLFRTSPGTGRRQHDARR